MYRSEIRDLQDVMKRWQRFRERCEHREKLTHEDETFFACRHNLTNGVMCNLAICPGGLEETKGAQYTADANGPFIG